MDIIEILTEVGKHAVVVAVFAALLALIVWQFFKNQQKDSQLIAEKQVSFEKEVLEKFVKVEDRFKNVDEHIHGVRQNVHKLSDNMNVAMSNIQNEVRDTNNNVKLLAVSLGKNPLDYIKEKE